MEETPENRYLEASKSAEVLRDLLVSSQDTILPFTREWIEAMAGSFEHAADDVKELRDSIDDLERGRILPAPRCWYYERFHGNCTACVVNKWCQIKLSYTGAVYIEEGRKNE